MTTNNSKQCPICKLEEQDVIREADYGERITYSCARCGKFTITRTAEGMAEKKDLGPKLSAWIRDRFELKMDIPEINSNSLTEIEKTLPDYNPSDKQLLFLKSIARKSKYPGDSVSLLPKFDYPLAWASAQEEFLFYIRYLIERGLLAHTVEEEGKGFDDMSVDVEVSADGWEYLEQHEKRAVELSQVFVAMSFSESMKTVWKQAIKPAITEAGFKAYRIDTELHIDRIDAKIIAEIKNSLFVVADVTEQKHGVYFEAGYAIGKNLPVIWCVRKDDLANVHFDTRQYNHIVWKSTQELKEKLYDIICAVIGRNLKI
jgi:nucleoside 2-deoxyribosyltransferase